MGIEGPVFGPALLLVAISSIEEPVSEPLGKVGTWTGALTLII